LKRVKIFFFLPVKTKSLSNLTKKIIRKIKIFDVNFFTLIYLKEYNYAEIVDKRSSKKVSLFGAVP